MVGRPPMRDSINAALHSESPEGLIDGVKRAVIEEFTSLDPAVEIQNTGYFNHTFVPDLVLSWRDGGRLENRDVFLRFSLRAAAIGRDVEALSHGSPVVLALREEGDPGDVVQMAQAIGESSDVLVTDVPALERFSEYSATTDRGHQSLGQQYLGQSSPLLSLVRSNLMKGARGVVTSDTARALRQRTEAGGPEEEVAGLRAFNDVIQNIFTIPIATRLGRAAQLMEIGLTGDVSPIAENREEAEDEGFYNLVRGRLSHGELRVLLPYLLSHPRITNDPRFWVHVGSMLSLEDLEDIASDIQNLDLTRLVVPNQDRWLATRAALAYNVEAERVTPKSPRWEFRARLLNLIIGDLRVMVSADRRRIKGREDNPPARWDELARSLADFHLTAVTLDGLNRRVRVAGERDSDIYDDVRTITENIHDQFHVPEVEVASSEYEGAPRIVADFRSMIATADNATTLNSLISVATRILGYRTVQDPPQTSSEA